GRFCLAQKSSFRWVIHKVIYEFDGAKFLGSRDRVVFTFALRAERGRVDENVGLQWSMVTGQRRGGYCELASESRRFGIIARHDRHFDTFVLQCVDASTCSSTGTDDDRRRTFQIAVEIL